MDPAQNTAKPQEDQEKYLRLERLAEGFTYAAVFVGVILTLLPYQFPFDKGALYKLLGFVVVFAFAWFRLLPRKFSGFKKTLIYYVASILFLAFAVHFTGGILSFAIFLFYLTVLSAAAGLTLGYFSTLIIIIAAILFIEAWFFGQSVPLGERMSLAGLHLWALVAIAAYARSIFDEEYRLKSSEHSKDLQNAKQIDAVKNEFVFVISNKLKEPILALQNYLETAEKAKDASWSKDLVELLTKTTENSQRLSSLVSDLSDLSKIESQKLRLELKKTILSQIIGSTLSDFNMRASEKKITITYEPGPEDLALLADPNRLHEILANLVDNAIKYSPFGARINVGYKVQDGKTALIWVKDTGYGIPEDSKGHLFEKFYRVNRSSQEAKGTGLGLFVTKELVERQNGKIWFESQVGQGTTFFISILLFSDGKA